MEDKIHARSHNWVSLSPDKAKVKIDHARMLYNHERNYLFCSECGAIRVSGDGILTVVISSNGDRIMLELDFPKCPEARMMEALG